MKLQKAVKQETLYVAAWIIVLSALMEAVFLIIGKWDYKVLLGNLLSASAGVLNFLLLGITVQKCVLKTPEQAKKAIKLSQAARLLMMVVIALIGALVPCFNLWSTLIPLVFPRISFLFRPLFSKKQKEEDHAEEE